MSCSHLALFSTNKVIHVGQTLNHIMSYSFSNADIDIKGACFSNIMPIISNATLSRPLCTAKPCDYYSCYINSLTANRFAEAYQSNSIAVSISSAAAQIDSFPYSISPGWTIQPILLGRPVRKLRKADEREWRKDHLKYLKTG